MSDVQGSTPSKEFSATLPARYYAAGLQVPWMDGEASPDVESARLMLETPIADHFNGYADNLAFALPSDSTVSVPETYAKFLARLGLIGFRHCL
jgi:hypothetical protein